MRLKAGDSLKLKVLPLEGTEVRRPRRKGGVLTIILEPERLDFAVFFAIVSTFAEFN